MAANLLDESPLTLAEAAKALPPLRGGRRVHLATLYRWVSSRVGIARSFPVEKGEAEARYVTKYALKEDQDQMWEVLGPTETPHAGPLFE